MLLVLDFFSLRRGKGFGGFFDEFAPRGDTAAVVTHDRGSGWCLELGIWVAGGLVAVMWMRWLEVAG